VFSPATGSGQGTAFVDAGLNPDWRVAGEELARAWEAGTGTRVDGVVSLDVSAVRELLRVTGPVAVPGYGQVNASTVAQVLLADVRAAPDSSARQVVTAAVLAELVNRLSSGGEFEAKAGALVAAAPGRHLQLWTREAAAEQLAEDNGLAGAVAAPASGDHLAVYSQVTDASAVDALQQRTVDEVVRLRADGSASVTRTVTQRNTAIDRPGGVSGATRTRLVTLLPPTARVASTPRPVSGSGPGPVGRATTVHDQAGRVVVRQDVRVPAGQVVTWSVTFTVAQLATVEGTGMTLPLLLEPSSTLVPTRTRTVVIPPTGWHTGSAAGVQVRAGQGIIDASLDRQQAFRVPLAKG
jgi:hypothetical protein